MQSAKAVNWDERTNGPDIIGIEDQAGNMIVQMPMELVNDFTVRRAVTPFMESAIKRGIEGYDADYYINLCCSGKSHLWVGINGTAIKGIMVTMKVEYPSFSVLRVLMCSGLPGSLETFGKMAWDVIVDWARFVGASKIEAWGRSGWERALSRYATPEKRVQVLSYEVTPE